MKFILIIMLCLLILVVTKIKFKTLYTINTVYTLSWGISFCFNLIAASQFHLIEPSDTIFRWVIINILIFNIIYVVFSKRDEVKIEVDYGCSHNNNVIYFFLIIVMLLMSNRFVITLGYLIKGHGFSYVRSVLYIGYIQSANGMQSILLISFPIVVINIAMVESAKQLVEKQYKLSIVTFLAMVMYIVCYGERRVLLNFVLLIAIYYIPNRKKIKINFYVILLLSIITVGIVLISISRGTEKNQLLKSAVGYFFSQFSYLEYIMTHKYMYGLNQDIHYGNIIFGFITTLPCLFLKLFIKDVTLPANTIGLYTQKYANISNSNEYWWLNAHTTSLYYYYFDLRELGIFMGPAVFALFVCFIQKMRKENKNIRAFEYAYIFLIIYVFESIIWYGLCELNFSLMMVLDVIMSQKVNVYIRHKRLGKN